MGGTTPYPPSAPPLLNIKTRKWLAPPSLLPRRLTRFTPPLVSISSAVAPPPQALGLQRDRQVAAAFTASHKTLAFGLPLFATVFAGSPALALLSAPLLVLHPAQLLFGGLLVPRLRRYTTGGRTQAAHGRLPAAAAGGGAKGAGPAAATPSATGAYSDRTREVIRRGLARHGGKAGAG